MYGENLVICDCEQEYAGNLLQVFNKTYHTEAQLYLFFSMEELRRFSEEKKIHCLLIAEEFPKEERVKIPAERTFVLVKDKKTLSGGKTAIFRYQSAEEIWRQMQEQELPKRKRLGKGKEECSRKEQPKQQEQREEEIPTQVEGRVIGVYSPIHRIGKTRFALELGKRLAKKSPVLYLNLEEYAGSEIYFPESQGKNLGDLLYFSRQEQSNLGMQISMMVGQLGQLDYVEPMHFLQDLKMVKPEEWMELLDQILQQCIYEKIILDLGDCVDGLYELLKYCDVIFTPYIEERIARAKLRQYTENLRKMGLEDVLEKTIQRRVISRREIRKGTGEKKGAGEQRQS